jgi:hypothetical protein
MAAEQQMQKLSRDVQIMDLLVDTGTAIGFRTFHCILANPLYPADRVILEPLANKSSMGTNAPSRSTRSWERR